METAVVALTEALLARLRRRVWVTALRGTALPARSAAAGVEEGGLCGTTATAALAGAASAPLVGQLLGMSVETTP